MKRAKKPPTADTIFEATVVADAIAVGRRDEPGIMELVHPLVALAIAEYLRLFPMARKPDASPWIEVELRETDDIGSPYSTRLKYTGERDFQCFFCRKSLNTLPSHRSITAVFLKPIRLHAQECGIRMLAGLAQPHAPLPKGAPGL